MPSAIDYLSASRLCDIVMKGGVTSGIVYPGAVCRLAQNYRFQSIGGTSAGAIAAAFTAAAEYRRAKGESVFEKLSEIPVELGTREKNGRSKMLNLFQPQRGMRGLFRISLAFLIKNWPLRLIELAKTLWLDLLVGAIPGALVIWMTRPNYPAGGAVLGAIVALAGAIASAIAGTVLRIGRLPGHRFGLCTGDVLAAWLHGHINALAGLTDRPLTFGDLRAAGIRLEMITTSLTYGRPYTLPFRSGEFFFSPSEMRAFFPAELVDWMEAHSYTPDPHGDDIDTSGFRALPRADDLPVVFATRLSLSFPLLFCAVPLYAIDWTRRRRGWDEPAPTKPVPGGSIAPDEPRRPEPVWFSDGGITSNFPLSIFDQPLPTHPTFGLDLQDLRPDRDAASDRVWVPETNRSGVAHYWMRLNPHGALRAAGGFISAIFDAAVNWNDNLQAMAPGYRDRIAHIYLSKEQGGLNLNMPAATVKQVAGYGAEAAGKLIDHFLYGVDDGRPTPMTWDNHRWVRYRSTMAVMQDFFAGLRSGLEDPESGDRSYYELIERGRDVPPASYQLTASQKVYALSLTRELDTFAKDMVASDLSEGAPRPEPALRIRPQF